MNARLVSRWAIVGLAALATTPGWASEGATVVETEGPGLGWMACPEFMPQGCQIAVLHGDPAQPNADILFRVPGDTSIPAHRHRSAERMVLLSGRLEVRYQGQDPAIIDQGNYAYGPAGLAHEAYCEAGDPCVLFIAFEEPVDATPVAP